MASAKKLYYIWNFFEKGGHSPPYKALVEGWKDTGVFIKKNYPEYVCTQLHRNLNPNGAYPFVNHAAFDGLSFDGFMQGPPSEKWLKRLKGKQVGPGQKGGPTVAFPGGYNEVSTNTGKKLAPWLPKDEKSLFILTAFKASNEDDSQFQETFEKDWKESSGANFILQNAPKELGIQHCGLYKKFTKKPGLLYVLRAELPGVGEQSEAAKAFLSELKAFSFPTYFDHVDSDLFYPDPENIIFPDAGQTDLPEGYSYKP